MSLCMQWRNRTCAAVLLWRSAIANTTGSVRGLNLALKYTLFKIVQESVLSLTLLNETVKSYSRHLLQFRSWNILHTWIADGLLQRHSITEYDRQCMYNVLLRCIHVIIVVIGTLYFIFQECHSFSYPACKRAILYGHPWPAWVYHIFHSYLIKVTIAKEKKDTEHKMYDLIFSKTFA